MADDWVDSLERALEVVGGQLKLAVVLNAKAVQVEVETLKKIYYAARCVTPENGFAPNPLAVDDQGNG